MAVTLLINVDVPCANFFESCQHPKRGGLATARRTKQDDEFAVVDFEGEVVDDRSVGEVLTDVIESDWHLIDRKKHYLILVI